MENQHRKITGYRELDQVEIDLMNEIKAQAESVGALIEKLRTMHYTTDASNVTVTNRQPADQRWVAIGATDLQKGFMALTRSIAKPTSF